MEITNLFLFFEVENRHVDKGKPIDAFYKVFTKSTFENVPHHGSLINVKAVFLGGGSTLYSENELA